MSITVNRSFPLDQLSEWGLPYRNRGIVVSTETEDSGRRWVDERTVVFRAPDDGYHYALCFDVGKTELQECSWDEELEDPVVLARVKLVQVKVDRWVPVEKGDGE